MAGNVLGKGYLGGHRHDDRHRLRADRGRGGARRHVARLSRFLEELVERRPAHDARSAMPAATAKATAPCFPALERRLDVRRGRPRTTSPTSATTAARVYYACQYAPPHEFQLNFPEDDGARSAAQPTASTRGRGFLARAVRAQRSGREHWPPRRCLALFLLGMFFAVDRQTAVRACGQRGRLLCGVVASRDGLDLRCGVRVVRRCARRRVHALLARHRRGAGSRS